MERLLRPVEPEARSRELTQAEKAQAFLEEQLARITSRERARRLSMTAFGGAESGIPGGMGAVDFVPFLGAAKGLEEGGRDIRQGNYDLESGRYGDAFRNYGAAVLGVLPGAAGAVKVAPRLARAIKAAPQDEALRLAQLRAALPLSQRGLGLPANNTPEQRAKAMKWLDEPYHGSLRDIKRLDPRVGSTESHAGQGVYSTDSPRDASQNYANIYGPDVEAKINRSMDEQEKDWRRMHRRLTDQTLTPRQQEILLSNTLDADNLGVVYPLKVRSDKSIHLDRPEENPVMIGPFEQYDEAADSWSATPHTPAFERALAEYSERGGETNPIRDFAMDYGGALPARDLFNEIQSRGARDYLYDPDTGDLISSGVAAADFLKHFGVDEIRHTPQFKNRDLNIAHEHIISLNPDNVRSRFAAFDPWRRDAATAAAMGVAAPDLLAKEKTEEPPKKKKKPEGALPKATK
jgi:hypothetical protein